MDTLRDRIQTVLDECDEQLGEEKQAKLGKIAGASNSVVSQWISGGIKTLRLDYALAIEKALGYNHVWLVLGSPHPKMTKKDQAGGGEPARSQPAQQGQQKNNMFSAAERALLYVDVYELRLITAYREATDIGRAMIEEVARTAPKQTISSFLTGLDQDQSPNHG